MNLDDIFNNEAADKELEKFSSDEPEVPPAEAKRYLLRQMSNALARWLLRARQSGVRDLLSTAFHDIDAMTVGFTTADIENFVSTQGSNISESQGIWIFVVALSGHPLRQDRADSAVLEECEQLYRRDVLLEVYRAWIGRASVGMSIKQQMTLAIELLNDLPERFDGSDIVRFIFRNHDGRGFFPSDVHNRAFVTALARSRVTDYSGGQNTIDSWLCQHVQDLFAEAFNSPLFQHADSLDGKYEAAVSLVPATEYSERDVAAFCRGFRIAPEGLGLFVSAVINRLAKSKAVELDLRGCSGLDYFGYKLSRDVVVVGDLGDHTAMYMSRGRLDISGHCLGFVGEFLGDPRGHTKPQIDVAGSVGDRGPITYSGRITSGSRKPTAALYRVVEDVACVLESDPHSLFLSELSQFRRGQVVSLSEKFLRMLHPDLVSKVCLHNVAVVSKQEVGLDRQIEDLEDQIRGVLAERARVLREGPRFARVFPNAVGSAGGGDHTAAWMGGSMIGAIFFPPAIMAPFIAAAGYLLTEGSRRAKWEEQIELGYSRAVGALRARQEPFEADRRRAKGQIEGFHATRRKAILGFDTRGLRLVVD